MLLLLVCEKTFLLVYISYSTLSSWIIHSSRRPCSERRAPKTVLDRRDLLDPIIVDPFYAVTSLRNATRQATGWHVAVRSVRTVMKCHGWMKNEARL
jgi:hypothetical protein